MLSVLLFTGCSENDRDLSSNRGWQILRAASMTLGGITARIGHLNAFKQANNSELSQFSLSAKCQRLRTSTPPAIHRGSYPLQPHPSRHGAVSWIPTVCREQTNRQHQGPWKIRDGTENSATRRRTGCRCPRGLRVGSFHTQA